jgi:hypothetical protein
MKKGLISLVVLMLFCFSSMAMAAADPFSDVPAKHWAYDAVNKLAKAGIVNGYADGTFRGDHTMTRIEMAAIVANAMTKVDQADAANKALIDKLTQEFGSELKSLGKRVEAIEKKQGPLTIDGFMYHRYEWTKNPRILAEDAGLAAPHSVGRADAKNVSQTTLWLNVRNQFDGNTYFNSALVGQYVGGQGTEGALEIKKAYFGGKMGDAELLVGRLWPVIGNGLLYATPYSDGVGLSFGKDKDVKVNLYSVKFGNKWVTGTTTGDNSLLWPLLTTDSNGNLVPYSATHATWNLADVKFNLTPELGMTLAYSKDNEKGMNNLYDEYAIGLEYKGITNFNIKGEWGQNRSEQIKNLHSFGLGAKPTADAYYVQAKYKGANPFKVGSFGATLTYVHADPGFDPMGQADVITRMPLNWSSPSGGNLFDNLKGFEYGIQTTLWPRVMLDVRYGDMKMVDTNHPLMPVAWLQQGQESQKYLTAQMLYIF